MSRSGYSDDLGQKDLAMWRGRVASAMRGKRGQKFFVDLLAALDALPEKRLIADELVTEEGAVCALGALGKHRGVEMQSLDPHDSETVAARFDIAGCLAQETVYENDEGSWGRETPEERFNRIRAWAASNIRKDATQ